MHISCKGYVRSHRENVDFLFYASSDVLKKVAVPLCLHIHHTLSCSQQCFFSLLFLFQAVQTIIVVYTHVAKTPRFTFKNNAV